MAPTTRYVQSHDWSIAYQVVGEGPIDLLFVPGFVWNTELAWEEPITAGFFERLATFARVIMFDKREQGQSDRLGRVPTLEEGLDDIQAVLRAAGSERAAVFGISEGGPLAMMMAATFPEQVSALVLYGTYARVVRAPDYPQGIRDSALDRWLEQIVADWGGPAGIRDFAPSAVGDAHLERWWARFLRAGGSPKTAAGLLDIYRKLDTREILPAISAPALVLHRSDDRLVPIEAARYLAEHLPSARFVEMPGADHIAFTGDTAPLLDEVEEFLTGVRPRPEPNRVLATVLFTDIVGSTKRASELGDRRWRDLLTRHDALVRREIGRYHGREVKSLGDGFLALFDGPQRAIRCAAAIRESVRALGIEVRAGLHTGECEQMNGDVGGMAVHIGARVASMAGPSEVLVSSTVKELVTGSGLEFDDRGSHVLHGVPGEWRVLAVSG